jgi:dipeptidyl aminopeptidase/acylaminoacyl peptidase
MKLPLPARASLTLAVLALRSPAPAHAQIAGGQSGYDTSLEAIEPTNEPVTVGLAGADPADIGRYLLAANGGVGGASLSPDGRSVAFSWSITGEPQLWVALVDGGTPRRLTYGNGITFFRWTPDGDRILYAADNDGNEQEAYYVIDADGASEQLVLPASSGGFRVFGGFAGKTSSIVYSSTERNGLDFDVYVSDLAMGGTRLVREGTYGYYAQAPSPDGRWALVAETVGEDSNALHLLDLASGELRTLSAPERRANHTNGGYAWAEDGSGVYLASNAGREYSALVFHRVDGGVDLVREAGGDIENVTLCGQAQRYLAWTVNEDGYDRLSVQDRTRGAMLDAPTLPEGVYGVSCEGEPARMLVRVTGWRTPGSVYVWDLATGTVHETFAPGLAGLDAERLVRPESVRIPARDGVELQGLLYLPDATSRRGQGAPPVVFLVHGGPTGQSRPTFDAIVQYHVDRGVAVFEPNVRGSTGFGHTYVTLDDREKRLDSVRDLVDMLEWLGRDGRVDASRAAVVGGSYGGYMVNAVLANFPGHFIAGAALYGVADWVTALGVASPALKASDRIEYGDITEQRWRDFYTVNSPIRQADRIDVPVLYSHGVRDPRIDIAETEVMVRTLRANGIDAPFVRIPDEGHGWRRLANQLFYYRRQAEFLEEKLGLGRPSAN